MIEIVATLPDGAEYDYSESVNLDGSSYDFRFVWNAREECWALSVSLDGVSIIASRPLVYGVDLFERSQGPRPVGALVVLSTRAIGAETTPGLADFGSVAKLHYITVEDDGSL
jgi:hypothetical protein